MKYAPALFGFAALVVWEAAVRITEVPSYLVPGPLAIVGAFLADPAGLLWSLVSTLLVTFAALLVAASLGVVLALAIASSRLLAAAIQPWAVVLQVTPIVAIAPLIIVWVGNPFASLVVCATIVAFFPVFANTAAGSGLGAAGAGRSVPPVWREPARDAVAAAPAGGAAVLPGRVAHLRRPGAGRRGGGGVRRRVGRVRLGAGVSHPGGRLPAAGAAHVRRTGAAVAGRDRDQLRHWEPFGTLRPVTAPRWRKPERYSAASRQPVGRTTCPSRSRYAACQSSAASTASPLRTCLKMSG